MTDLVCFFSFCVLPRAHEKMMLSQITCFFLPTCNILIPSNLVLACSSTIIPKVTNDIFIGMVCNQYTQATVIDLSKTLALENHQLWLLKAASAGLGRTARKPLSGHFFTQTEYVLHNDVKVKMQQLN